MRGYVRGRLQSHRDYRPKSKHLWGQLLENLRDPTSKTTSYTCSKLEKSFDLHTINNPDTNPHTRFSKFKELNKSEERTPLVLLLTECGPVDPGPYVLEKKYQVPYLETSTVSCPSGTSLSRLCIMVCGYWWHWWCTCQMNKFHESVSLN